jgi:hypothetical protein
MGITRRYHPNSFLFKLFAGAPLMFGTLATQSVAQTHALAPLPGDDFLNIYGLSDDGTEVTGSSSGLNSGPRAFVWKATTGYEVLLLPGNSYSQIEGAAPNLQSIRGSAFNDVSEIPRRQFLWSHDAGLVNLNEIFGYSFLFTSAVSVDGTAIAGSINASQRDAGAFVATSSGEYPFIELPQNLLQDQISVYGVSSRADTVVGLVFHSGLFPANHKAFVWTQGSGLQFIDPPSGFDFGSAEAVSEDGSTVVGTFWTPSDTRIGFRRGGDGTIVQMEPPEGFETFQPYWVNTDGSVILGYASSPAVGSDVVWTPETGMQLLVLPGHTSTRLYGTLQGTHYTRAGDTVALESVDSSNHGHAVVWRRGLGERVIHRPGDVVSHIGAVSRDGSAVLASSCEDVDETRCKLVRWESNDSTTILEALEGHSYAQASSVSIDGSIVGGGSCTDDFAECRGIVWSSSGIRSVIEPIEADTYSWVEFVSGDGSTIVASSCPTGGRCRSLVKVLAEPNQVSTPPGTNVSVEPVVTLPGGGTPVAVELTFGSVQSGGTTTVTASDTPISGVPEAPSNFKIGEPPVYYDVDTTATFSGQIDLCFSWQEGQFDNEGNIALFHFIDDAWQNVTTSLDVAANKVCGAVRSLSPFSLFETSYSFAGFFAPVDSQPTVNVVNAGAAVPLKFSLGGNQGLGILAAGYPSSKAIACDASAPSDTLTETLAASSSGLKYDAATNTYTYVWKTDKAWARTCRRLTMKLIDGTIESADFQFKK